MQPQAEPIPIITQISERIDGGPLTEFEFAKFTDMANKLIKNNIDKAAGLCALGMLACLRKDIPNLHKYHKAAILAASGDDIYVYNYAYSLERVELYDEAAQQIKKAVSLEPFCLKNLNKAIWLSFLIGSNALDEYLARWSKLTNGEQHPVVEALENEDSQDRAAAESELANLDLGACVNWNDLKAELGLQ